MRKNHNVKIDRIIMLLNEKTQHNYYSHANFVSLFSNHFLSGMVNGASKIVDSVMVIRN